MKISKIFAGMSALAIAASMTFSASAAEGGKLVSDTEAGTNDTWQLCPSSVDDGSGISTNVTKPIADIYDIPVDVLKDVTKVTVTVTCTNLNYEKDDDGNDLVEDGGYANGQIWVSAGDWVSFMTNAGRNDGRPVNFTADEPTQTVEFDFACVQDKDTGEYSDAYSVGMEEYGGGSYTFDAVVFYDVNGAELAKWTPTGATSFDEPTTDDPTTDKPSTDEPTDEPTTDEPTDEPTDTDTPADTDAPADTDTPASTDDGKTETPSDNTANQGTGAAAGVALAGIALAGAAFVVSKRK